MIAEPMDVMDLGRMAIFADPTGAVFGIWQPGTFLGAGLVNEPGAIAWNELNTRDPEAAKAFYGAVFGWAFEDKEMEEAGTYTTIKLGEDPVGGMLDMAGAASPTRCPPTGWSTSRSRTPTRRSRRRRSAAAASWSADRHPSRPLRRSSPTRTGPSFAVIALSDEALENA